MAGFFALCLIYILLNFWRLRRPHRDEASRKFEVPFRGIISIVIGVFLIWQGLKGRQSPPGEFIDLAAPLEAKAAQCVLSGGASTAVNLHYIVGPNGAVGEEVHSIDFVKLNKGFRTIPNKLWHPKPLKPEDYAIYGSPIFAPCNGTVISADDGKSDQLAGFRYRDGTGSNQVTLNCGGTLVMLAHLRNGSVSVSEGETVTVGQKVGLVGNTGNTEEPHLHIHAFEEAETGNIPVPMRFHGRFLSRGDCL